MKVTRGDGRSPDTGSSSPKVDRKDKPSFVEAISDAKQGAVDRDRDELIAKIEEQAARLVKRKTVTEMDKYRELITEFMKMAVGESYEMKEIPSARFLDNNKVFLIAKKVEEKLLEMAEKIREGTAEAMAITVATSEIRGMLLDMKI